MPRDGGAGGEVDLWAMAAELERQFAGYKQRRARGDGDDGDDDADADARGGGEEVEEEGDGEGGGDVRGRKYEAYTRRRDERLREGWRARMERKEAEVKALWAQLERGAGGRAAGCVTATTDDDAGEKAGNDGEKRRRSDVAASASRNVGSPARSTRAPGASRRPPRRVAAPTPGRGELCCRSRHRRRQRRHTLRRLTAPPAATE